MPRFCPRAGLSQRVLTARGHYDAAARTYTLELAQRTDPTPGQPTKLPFHIPFAVGLVGPDGRDVALTLAGAPGESATTRVLDFDAPSQAYTFVDVRCAPVPSLARGYSAPVRVCPRLTPVSATGAMRARRPR